MYLVSGVSSSGPTMEVSSFDLTVSYYTDKNDWFQKAWYCKWEVSSFDLIISYYLDRNNWFLKCTNPDELKLSSIPYVDSSLNVPLPLFEHNRKFQKQGSKKETLSRRNFGYKLEFGSYESKLNKSSLALLFIMPFNFKLVLLENREFSNSTNQGKGRFQFWNRHKNCIV